MNDIVRQMRETLSAILPQRAFLRRDRGDALYISNAPRFDSETDWAACCGEAGFRSKKENGLLQLWPAEAWLKRLEDQFDTSPDFLCSTLERFKKLPVDEDNLNLFALGMRCLDGDNSIIDYEKRLRNRIAVCLRSDVGGGLYACGLLNHIIKEDNP